MPRIREPEWFRTEPFARQVILWALRELGEISPATAEDLNGYPEAFREAVQTVGRSVFTLQLMIRNRLRPLFIESMNLLVGMVGVNSISEICKFMGQGYLQKDIYKETLSCFAIIGELNLFLFEFGRPIPFYWIHMPWCAIYEHVLRDPLELSGGWERLLEVARSMYIDNGFYRETYLSYVNNNRIPHSEVRRLNNWPVDSLEFLDDRFPYLPSTTLSMKILQEIYRDISLTPIPGAGADEIRALLGPQHPEEGDWI